MTDLRCTIRHLDGSATTVDVTVATPPNTWSPADAKEFLWAGSRLPASVPIHLLHVLPSGFHRIRYYGWLGHRHRTETLARCRQLLGTAAAQPIAGETLPPSDYRDRYECITGVSLRTCPVCADGHLIVTECLRRARPYPVFPDTS